MSFLMAKKFALKNLKMELFIMKFIVAKLKVSLNLWSELAKLNLC